MRLGYFIISKLLRGAFAGGFKWRILNAERVPRQGPVILAANHASFLDPPLIGASLPREIHYLARETLFRSPAIAAFIKACNAVPVDREGVSPAGLKAILERLNAGAGIVLFPEGTRTADGRLQTARPGVGLVVIRSVAPVVPVRLFGTFEAMGRQRAFPRPYAITLKYGLPIGFEAQRAEAQTCDRQRLKAIYQEVATAIMAAIASLTPQEDCERFPLARP